ncbi:MAG: hypothetical protein ACXVCY_13210 [Pseudobdellovibrionaceae bacterium]
MNQIFAKLILVLIFLAQVSAQAEVPQIPEDWYTNPEDGTAKVTASFFPTLPWSKKGKMENLVKSIFEVNRSSVETAMDKQTTPATGSSTIPNWTPWHLESFTTELSVVSSGLIGVLTGKGTATALAYWRRAAEKTAAPKNFAENENDSVPTLAAENISDDSSLKKEMEPIIKSALATGKIKDEGSFRRNMESAAVDFYNLVTGLEQTQDLKWFVSGFRVEFSVSASGTLTPAVPITSVGGDVRVRFDWKRLAHKNQSAKFAFSKTQNKLQLSLQDLVTNLAQDFGAAFDEDSQMKGFKPYLLRIGLGFTASGTVGVAKSSASAVAYLTLSQNVKDPASSVVRLVPSAAPLLLIEQNPSQAHLDFAANNFIPVATDAKRAQAVYSIDRGNFRKGLKKAIKMSHFFVAAGSKADSKKWKLYQMKTSFEFSITGTVGLVKYGGASSADMAFYNMNF